jgi:hypothetical protein
VLPNIAQPTRPSTNTRTCTLQNRHRWADLEFPDVFGRRRTKEERFIEELDEKTGASLKLTLLNPEGRIWNLVAGGGASVIFADTVADLGYGNLLVCAIVRLCDCAIGRLVVFV